MNATNTAQAYGYTDPSIGREAIRAAMRALRTTGRYGRCAAWDVLRAWVHREDLDVLGIRDMPTSCACTGCTGSVFAPGHLLSSCACLGCREAAHVADALVRLVESHDMLGARGA